MYSFIKWKRVLQFRPQGMFLEISSSGDAKYLLSPDAWPWKSNSCSNCWGQGTQQWPFREEILQENLSVIRQSNILLSPLQVEGRKELLAFPGPRLALWDSVMLHNCILLAQELTLGQIFTSHDEEETWLYGLQPHLYCQAAPMSHSEIKSILAMPC